MSDKKDTVKVVLKTSSLAPGAKNVDLNSLRQILARAQNRQQLAKAPVTQTDGDEKRQDISRKTPEVPKKTSISTKVFPDKNAGAQNDDAQSIGVEDKDKAPISPTRVTESTGYTCCFCAFHSEDPESYRKHIASHIRNKGLCCNTCSFSTDKINAFNEHVRTAHKKVPPIKTTYACGVCDFKAFTSETLWKHKISTKHHKLNDKNEPIACRLCGHLETNVYKQVQHIMSHSRADVECDLCDDPQDSDVQKHSDDCPEVVSPLAHQYDELLQKPGRRSYQCTLCDFQTEQLLFLMEHIKAHSRFRPSADETKELDSPFSCTMCEYKCVRPSKLVLHMKTHGPGTIFRCKDCKFESSDMEIFKSHWKRHSSIRFYRCFVCLEQFPSSRALNAHMVTHTKGAPLECSICDFKCLSKNRLILHTKSHAKVPKTILSFPCSLCKNKYSTHAALKIHLKSHDASDRPYQCKHCPYNCFTPELLKIHLKKHSSNGSKFRCEICMLSFPTEAQLRGHVQDHVTYDKPVNCELCNTSFVSKAQLSKHMAIHSGKYPFVCAVCSTGFMDEAAKKEHLLNVHEIQDQGGPSSTSGKDIVELEEDEQIVSVEEQPSTQFGYLEENVDEDSEDELAH